MKSIILCFSLLLSFNLFANPTVEQKMIVVKGENSYLMKGDSYQFAHNKPSNYGKKKVLPALLESGWYIKSVHINEKSTEKDMYGYVVIEKQN